MTETTVNLDELRRDRLESPTPGLQQWQKRAKGIASSTQGAEVVNAPWVKGAPQGEPQSPRVPTAIVPVADTGSPSIFDHRHPGIEEGVTRKVRPEGCPPATRKPKRSVAATLLVDSVESLLVELDIVHTRVAERSDNNSDAIPILWAMLELTRQWLPELRSGRGRMFISHARLLEREMESARKLVTARWGEYSAEAQSIARLEEESRRWVRTLNLAE